MQPDGLDIRLFWWTYWLYLGSFLLFTVFGATRSRRAGKLANLTLGAGFVLHSLGLAWRWRLAGHVPMANMYEYASLLAWMAALSYIYIEFRYRRTIVGTFVAPVLVAVMTCASLLPKEITQQLMPALQSYWLWIHVSLAALGEGAFAVAFAVSCMYLIQEARRGAAAQAADDRAAASRPTAADALAHRPGQVLGVGVTGGVALLELDGDLPTFVRAAGSPAGVRGSAGTGVSGGTGVVAGTAAAVLPSLRLLDEINYRAVAIGYPLFTIGALFAGAIWAYEAWGSFWSWDPKEVGALIIWLFYTAYLHARLQRAWQGRRAAWLSIAGFVIVILSFLGNLWLGGNHSYT